METAVTPAECKAIGGHCWGHRTDRYTHETMDVEVQRCTHCGVRRTREWVIEGEEQ